MKQHLFLLILAFFLTTCAGSMVGQSILIETLGGETHTELLSNIQNLHFATGDLVLQLNNGAQTTFALSGLKKLRFDTSIGIADQRKEKLSVIPNPAVASIRLEGLPENARNLSVFTPDGRLVLKQVIESKSPVINISDINAGIYILNIDGQIVKFIKQ